MMTVEREEKAALRLAEVRREHIYAEGLLFGDGFAIMRKPTPEEFLKLAVVAEQQQRGKLFTDPQKVTRPVLDLLVEGLEEAKAELEERPQFVAELYELAAELAGNDAITIDEDPELVRDNPKAKQLLGLKVCDVPMIVRKINQFDWSRHTAIMAKAGTAVEGMAQLAVDQLYEAPDKTGGRPKWDALCRMYPALPVELGSELQRRARSRTERIQGKSPAPSETQSETQP